jgi:hypothetical protein
MYLHCWLVMWLHSLDAGTNVESSTVAQLCSVCGRLYSVWFIETSLRRCLYGWRIWQEVFFSAWVAA